jgi:hypothetical protein
MLLRSFGLSIDLPYRWEGVIALPPPSEDGSAPYPVLRAGNFALPVSDGSFGENSIMAMDPTKAMVVVVEYGPTSAGTVLFTSGVWPPLLSLADLNPNAFSGTHPHGLAGHQNFVTVNGRAFCFYTVMGFDGRQAPLLDEVNAVLTTMAIQPVE